MLFRCYIISAAALLLAFSSVYAEQDVSLCGNPFHNDRGVGPYDYLSPADRSNRNHIPTLEKHHFNMDVRTGRRGQSSSVLKDLDFILTGCPNHHRALYTLINYHLKHDPVVPYTMSAACYLDRAARFNPDDGTVQMLAGIYNARRGKLQDAHESYLNAMALIPESSELHYNLGLLYLKMNEKQRANEHAVTAYRLGAQLPGLKRKLINTGAWDPAAVPVPEPVEARPVAEPQLDDSEAVEAQVSEAEIVD